MRSLFLILLFSTQAFAQLDVGNGTVACTDSNTDFTQGGTFECASLTISNSFPGFDLSAPRSPLLIKVKGNVIIRGNLNFNGEDGSTINVPGFGTSVGGGRGSLGAGSGGGVDSTQTTQNGSDLDPSSGQAAFNDAQCGGGGGGAGFVFNGEAGQDCQGAGGGVGGIAGILFDVSSGVLRGGFGGGSGGDSNAARVGIGGGGGGAFHLTVGGTVLIEASLTADGGRGGNGDTDGGGGGGGSGGVIWIESNGSITNTNTISAHGGPGGNSVASGNGSGKGGDGSRGVIILRSINGGITNTGSIPDYAQQSQNTPTLSSDIGCGLVKDEEHEPSKSLLLSVMMGFFLVMMFRNLFLYLGKILKKTALLN